MHKIKWCKNYLVSFFQIIYTLTGTCKNNLFSSFKLTYKHIIHISSKLIHILQSIDSDLNRHQTFLDNIDYTGKATHGNYSLRKCPQQCYCKLFLDYYQWLLNGMYTVLVLLNNHHFISFSKRLKINWAITLLEVAISKLKE